MKFQDNNARFMILLYGMVLIFMSNSLSQKIIEQENNGFIKLWLEAENGQIEAPMKIWDNNDASGGQFIEVIGGNNNMEHAPESGRIVYTFSLKTRGIYKVWGRVIASMDEEDAFWVKMDERDWVKWKDIAVGCDWHWDEIHDNENKDQVMEYNLEKGSHTLTFAYLLDQTRLDKLLITNDLNYVPDEIGPGVSALYNISNLNPSLNANIQFDASDSMSTEGKIISYDWDFGEGSTASGKSVSHSYKKTGEFNIKLTVKDNQGLSGRLIETLTVYTDDPVAGFSYSPDRSEKNEGIGFNASPSFDPNGMIENYEWDFGDGSAGFGKKIKHSYSLPGEYNVKLTITDSEGKTVGKTRLVTVITGIPKKVIYETDMCLDVDDVGALAVLHALANNNEVELLAVCFNEVHPFGASAIDAINTWYGRGNIPVGIYKKSLSKPDFSAYTEAVSKFPNDVDQKNIPSAIEVYRDVLNKQPDGSVTIISVGFLNNLNDLLNKYPDVIARKVKELVIMSGVNNDGFNLVRHNLVSASENVIRNWPTPLVTSQPGGRILTGTALADLPVNNPVREAYYKFFHDNFCGRPSWDQVAVLYGVRGLSDYFTLNTTDKGSLPNGFVWSMKEGHRSFIEARLTREEYAHIIQQLMLEAPLAEQ